MEFLFVEFFFGYIAILATPGPNLLAIGGTAALRGLRGTVPLCLGTALGTGALCTVLLSVAGAIPPTPAWRTAGGVVGAAMLLWVAATIAQRGPPEGDASRGGRSDAAALAIGFANAATNPVTGAFFAAQFLGPLVSRGPLFAFVPLLVVAAALSFFLVVAALLSRPALRSLIVARDRPIRLSAAATLVAMAGFTLGRALSGHG